MRVEVAEDLTATSRCDEGFLTLRRLVLRNAYADGSKSASYRYDVLQRSALDAVVVLPFFEHAKSSEVQVCLRTALRPPLSFREDWPEEASPVLWEAPAGILELDEQGPDPVRACAARELLEETGFSVDASRVRILGPAAFVTPGAFAEKLHFTVVEVDPETRGIPTEDGSPAEERAEVRYFSLEDALQATRSGEICDMKTELVLRRLAESLSRRKSSERVDASLKRNVAP